MKRPIHFVSFHTLATAASFGQSIDRNPQERPMSHRLRKAAETAPSRSVGQEHHQSEHDFLVSHSGLGTRVLYRLLTLLDRRLGDAR
jgi:hypothetical protein